MACSTADRMEETWRLNWLFAFRGVKPWVLWRVFYLAQAVAGWGWLMVVCSPTSMDSDSGGGVRGVSRTGGVFLPVSR